MSADLQRSLRKLIFDEAKALVAQKVGGAAARGPAQNPRRRAERVLCAELGITRKALRKMGTASALAMLEDKLAAARNKQAPPPKSLGVGRG